MTVYVRVGVCVYKGELLYCIIKGEITTIKNILYLVLDFDMRSKLICVFRSIFGVCFNIFFLNMPSLYMHLKHYAGLVLRRNLFLFLLAVHFYYSNDFGTADLFHRNILRLKRALKELSVIIGTSRC